MRLCSSTVSRRVSQYMTTIKILFNLLLKDYLFKYLYYSVSYSIYYIGRYTANIEYRMVSSLPIIRVSAVRRHSVANNVSHLTCNT